MNNKNILSNFILPWKIHGRTEIAAPRNVHTFLSLALSISPSLSLALSLPLSFSPHTQSPAEANSRSNNKYLCSCFRSFRPDDHGTWAELNDLAQKRRREFFSLRCAHKHFKNTCDLSRPASKVIIPALLRSPRPVYLRPFL